MIYHANASQNLYLEKSHFSQETKKCSILKKESRKSVNIFYWLTNF